jgi:hypothetical protein
MFRPAIRKNDGALLFSFPIANADCRFASSSPNRLGSGYRPTKRAVARF